MLHRLIVHFDININIYIFILMGVCLDERRIRRCMHEHDDGMNERLRR